MLTGDGQRSAATGASVVIAGDVPAAAAAAAAVMSDVERGAVMKTSDVQNSLSNFSLIKVLGKGSFGKV